MALSIFLIISLFIVAIQTAIPFLVKRTVVFGVTVPEQYIKDAKIVSFKKLYSTVILLLSIISLGAYCAWVLMTQPTEEHTVLLGTLIQFGIIFISLSIYFYFHAKTIQLKKVNKWTESLKQVKISDLSVRTQDEMLPWYVFLLPVIISVGVLGYTIMQYDLLPDQIPTHWGINGEADAFTDKTPMSAISMLLVLILMQIMFLGVIVGTKKSGIKLSATGTNASRTRQLTLRKYTSWFMFLVNFLFTIMFSLFQLRTIHPDLLADTAMIATPMIFLVVVLVGSILFAIKVGRSDKLPVEVTSDNVTDYDEDSYWKGGLFYFNKNDPSIFVEKRFGVGWTLNFANPIGYLIVFIPLIIILVMSFL